MGRGNSSLLAHLATSEAGAETLEWGLVCGLLIAGAIAVIVLIAPKVASIWNSSNDAIPAASRSS